MINNYKIISLSLTVIVPLLLLVVSNSAQDQVNTNYSVNQSANHNTEIVKFGNKKKNNYNIHTGDYVPTQVTQVVLNVPKSGKKSRKSRPPSIEEYAIKRKILSIYANAKRELEGANLVSPELEHLGQVLMVLNPKYIATERVRNVAFADGEQDPLVPSTLAPAAGPHLPPPSTSPPGSDQHLAAGEAESQVQVAETSVHGQLQALESTFRETIRWDYDFVAALADTPDETLSPTQLGLKRLLMCFSYPTHMCDWLTNESVEEHQRQLANAVAAVVQVPSSEEPSEPAVFSEGLVVDDNQVHPRVDESHLVPPAVDLQQDVRLYPSTSAVNQRDRRDQRDQRDHLQVNDHQLQNTAFRPQVMQGDYDESVSAGRASINSRPPAPMANSTPFPPPQQQQQQQHPPTASAGVAASGANLRQFFPTLPEYPPTATRHPQGSRLANRLIGDSLRKLSSRRQFFGPF